MTENVLESGQEAAGAIDQPGQQASGATGDQQASGVDMLTLVPALLQNPDLVKLIDERAERQWQSGKDRRIGKLEQRQDTVESVVAEFQKLTQGGMTADDALHRMNVERFMAQDQAQKESVSQNAPAGSGAQAATVDIAALLKILNLDANDPEIVEMLRTNKDSANDFTQLALSRQAQAANPPNPAGVMPLAGGGGGSTDDQTADAIVARMKVLQKQDPMGNRELLAELSAKLEALM